MPKYMPIAERLERFSIPEPNSGCVLFLGYLNRDGYGRIGITRAGMGYAHRVAYEVAIGPIPAGMTIDHLCRNRSCVNPVHLEAVTQGVNVLRGNTLTAKLARVTECPSGHPYTEPNTYRQPDGGRNCRTCMKARRQRRAAQPPARQSGPRACEVA